MSEEKSVLFKKSDHSASSQDDVWDDTALIRAYEKSVNAIQKKINSGLNISDKKKLANEDPEAESEGVLKDWRVLDLCTAVYSEDGLVYPATIQEIYEDDGDDNGEKKCRIQYVDYLNEEDKYLSELMEYNENEFLEEQEEESKQAEDKGEKKPKAVIGEFPGLAIPPPPPPPMFTSASTGATNEDSLYSMLLAWYMSGYQTGYYFAKNGK